MKGLLTMSTARFDHNPNYRKYVDLLRRLHVLMSSGRGDDAEADELRDEMDGPWRGLNEAEIARVRELSASLTV